MLTGILPVDKPATFTSFDVIGKLRGVTHTKKIGHSGTLDPMATGVLPLFFGDATKVCSVLPNEDKCYVAVLRFGVTTDTEDMTGRVLTEVRSSVTKEEFLAVTEKFLGEQKQTPPMYSAVKVGGRPLYDLAREGKEIERPSKDIVIYEIKLLDFSEDAQTAKIEVSCGKGTYIRTLISDMGKALGCGAAMETLRRTKAGGFSIEECYTIEEIQSLMNEGKLEERLLPMERLFDDLPKLILDDYDTKLYKNGVPLELKKRGWSELHGRFAVCDGEKNLLGLSEADSENNELKLIKMFAKNG